MNEEVWLSAGPSMPVRAQADVYRPLRLPVVLVGDGRLGGISSTIAAYEALVSRGYEVRRKECCCRPVGWTVWNQNLMSLWMMMTVGVAVGGRAGDAGDGGGG